MTGVNQTPQDNSAQQHPSQDAQEQETGAVVYQCEHESQRAAAIKHAQQAVASDECVVMPTDTVYGIAANAFSAAAVQRLLEAKGRNRSMPPPVLIAHSGVLDGLADQVSDEARALAQAFWPGGLTLICHAQPSLQWDLGDTQGTVALRVPDDDVARELLTETGPLAVSSANRTGLPAATTAKLAQEMLQDKVSVYLDAGPRGKVGSSGSAAHPVLTRAPQASTIVDCTGATPVVVRDGAISLAQLREVVPGVIGTGERAQDSEQSTEPGGEDSAQVGSDAVEAGETAQVSQDAHQADPVDGDSGEAASEVAPAEQTADEFDVALEPADTGSSVDQGSVMDDEVGERPRSTAKQSTSVDRIQAEALVSSGAGLAVSVTAETPDLMQADTGAQHRPGPDQNRRRPARAAAPGHMQPVDRATAAALVARGSEDGYDSGPGSADQNRH